MNKNDVERWFTKGQGAGGQKINKTSSTVCLKHIPTGIMVKCQEQRTQSQNELRAWEILTEKLKSIHDNSLNKQTSIFKQEQIGSGVRSEKRRTYRVKEDLVIDHITNRTTTLKNIYKGKLELLH